MSDRIHKMSRFFSCPSQFVLLSSARSHLSLARVKPKFVGVFRINKIRKTFSGKSSNRSVHTCMCVGTCMRMHYTYRSGCVGLGPVSLNRLYTCRASPILSLATQDHLSIGSISSQNRVSARQNTIKTNLEQ